MKNILLVLLIGINLLVKAQCQQFVNSIQRVNPASEFQWIKQISGTGNITPFTSRVDKTNNVYIVGTFTGQLSQGSITLNSYGGNDGFVAKFDNSGSLLWIKQIGGIGNESVNGIALSIDGNSIYVAGTFQYKCKFSTSDSLVVTGIQDATNTEVYLAKYALDGSIQSKKKITWGRNNTDDLQYVRAFGIDKNGKFLIGGFFKNKIYFANDSLIGNANYQNYIVKINEDGTVINKKLISGTDATNGTFIYSMDVCNNAYYWVGNYKNNLTFDLGTISSNGGTVDMFIYKTDFNLNGQWIRKISGAGNEYCTSVSCDSLNNIYVGGYFNTASPGITIDSTATLSSVMNYITKGGYDQVYAKYDENGTLQFSNSFGCSIASSGDDMIFRACYKSGILSLGGKFGGTFTFNGLTATFAGGTGTDMINVVFYRDKLFSLTTIGGTAIDIGETSVIDNDFNIYLIGDFASTTVTVGGTTLTNGGGKDLLIAKYRFKF